MNNNLGLLAGELNIGNKYVRDFTNGELVYAEQPYGDAHALWISDLNSGHGKGAIWAVVSNSLRAASYDVPIGVGVSVGCIQD